MLPWNPSSSSEVCLCQLINSLEHSTPSVAGAGGVGSTPRSVPPVLPEGDAMRAESAAAAEALAAAWEATGPGSLDGEPGDKDEEIDEFASPPAASVAALSRDKLPTGTPKAEWPKPGDKGAERARSRTPNGTHHK